MKVKTLKKILDKMTDDMEVTLYVIQSDGIGLVEELKGSCANGESLQLNGASTLPPIAEE